MTSTPAVSSMLMVFNPLASARRNPIQAFNISPIVIPPASSKDMPSPVRTSDKRMNPSSTGRT